MSRFALLSVLSFVVACSSSSGSGSSSGATPPGTPPGTPPTGGAKNALSTSQERKDVCNAIVPKCEQPYGNVGACIDDYQSVAGCFARSVLACVNALSKCASSDLDACMSEGSNACAEESLPPYVTKCLDRATACKPEFPPDQAADIQKTIEDSCYLLPALDDSGRTRGATCEAGPCSNLEKCITEITP
jgi:hypothetical protein